MTMIEKLAELMGKREELHPELKRYFRKKPFPIINHPLIQSPLHMEQMNALVNAQFEKKKAYAKELRRTRQWARLIFLHERPFRLGIFLEIQHRLSDRQYWKLLGDIWTDSENIWQYKWEWADLLFSNRPQKQFFMDAKERKAFKALPESFTIYRGYQMGKNKKGFSYTLEKERAEWFAQRFSSGAPKVLSLEVKKADCFAYLSGRNEEEIIYLKGGI